MFYEVAQQQEALWPQLDLSIAAAQGTASKIERKSRKTIGFLADRLHRLALSLREIGPVPWWGFQHFFRIFAPRFQAIIAVVVRSLHSKLFPSLTTAFRSRWEVNRARDHSHRCARLRPGLVDSRLGQRDHRLGRESRSVRIAWGRWSARGDLGSRGNVRRHQLDRAALSPLSSPARRGEDHVPGGCGGGGGRDGSGRSSAEQSSGSE